MSRRLMIGFAASVPAAFRLRSALDWVLPTYGVLRSALVWLCSPRSRGGDLGMESTGGGTTITATLPLRSV